MSNHDQSKTPVAKTWFELEREEATETTMRTVIRRLLERKFGKLAPTVLEKLTAIPRQTSINCLMRLMGQAAWRS